MCRCVSSTGKSKQYISDNMIFELFGDSLQQGDGRKAMMPCTVDMLLLGIILDTTAARFVMAPALKSCYAKFNR